MGEAIVHITINCVTWTKRGPVLNLTSLGNACMVALQTQTPKVTPKDSLRLKLF